MANFTTDLSNKANGAASEFKKQILSGEHQLEKMAHSAGDKVGAKASDFADTTAASMQHSREYIEDHPIKVVAIAAAAGLVAGSLLTLAIRSRKD